eukprot:scaffold183_cov249-Pinguiococcus_pyrenoidosus.AAC.21
MAEGLRVGVDGPVLHDLLAERVALLREHPRHRVGAGAADADHFDAAFLHGPRHLQQRKQHAQAQRQCETHGAGAAAEPRSNRSSSKLAGNTPSILNWQKSAEPRRRLGGEELVRTSRA